MGRDNTSSNYETLRDRVNSGIKRLRVIKETNWEEIRRREEEKFTHFETFGYRVNS